MSDITPPKRTIRDIPVPPHRRRMPSRDEQEMYQPPPPPADSGGEMKRVRRFRFPKIVVVIASIGVICLLGILATQFLRVHAVVTIVEKTRGVSIDGTFIAKKDAIGTELPFETIASSKEETKSVPATGEKTVETRASGTIIIYNDYSSASQRLITNTRFETPEGRIYRIDKSVTVPGKNSDTGVPGSIEVVVYADAAGKEYNIDLTDFTIPGFKGDPRYGKFFARSKTPMTGGFIGKIKTASAEDITKAREELRTSLRDELTKNIAAQIPSGYVLFDDAVYVEFETLSPPDSSELREKASAYGLIFNEKKLSSGIAAVTIADYDGSEIVGDNLFSLSFTPIPADAKPWQTGVVSFSLKGTTTLTWLFDSEKLRGDLVGQPKEKQRITNILEAYPSIDSAEVVVRPFWRKTLPESPEAIDIKIAEKEK